MLHYFVFLFFYITTFAYFIAIMHLFVGVHMTVLHTLLEATLNIKPLIGGLVSVRAYRHI